MPRPYVPNDAWSKRAAKEGYRARSVYKLQELDERYQLFRQGMRVLDIGAAPGSWLQYVSKRVGSSGSLLGLDLQVIDPIAPTVTTCVCDVHDAAQVDAALHKVGWSQADIVLSDIAPNTSGIKDRDQWLSIELSEAVVRIAQRVLRPKGFLVMKVFRGKDFDGFLHRLKSLYSSVRSVTVKASRDRSREVYVVCR